MVWKKSKSGHWYLYKNRRRGNRVITQYIGTGAVAELAVRREALRRAERHAEMCAWREEQRDCAELDESITNMCAAIERLLMAELLLAGFHCHEWAWRKRRVKHNSQKAA
jgi:hypothetical protein